MEYIPAVTSHVRGELAKVLIGQQEAADQLLLVLLCNGHVLIEGAPGLAKTLMVKTLARICGLGFQRVQCTSDLMPADVTGTNVFNLQSTSFQLHKGPVFTDLLLVDEINRTAPRTQAALLESMEERQVTIDGVRYPLSEDFTVLATQNPIEFEGTYPLPEAQLDRFLLKVRIQYPNEEEEVAILTRYDQGFDSRNLQAVDLRPIAPGHLAQARAEIRSVRVEPGLLRYVVSIVRKTRDSAVVALGASPRAAIALLFVARAIAGMDGRDYVIPDDVKAASKPVLRHRLALKPEADLEGMTSDQAVEQIVASVPIPK